MRKPRFITAERVAWFSICIALSAVFFCIGVSFGPQMISRTGMIRTNDESTSSTAAMSFTVTKANVSQTTVTTASGTTTSTLTMRMTTVATPTTSNGLINLNTATKEQLMSVKGIGEVFADRILEYREKYGRFTSIEDLLDIKGIGEGRYAQWSSYFTVD